MEMCTKYQRVCVAVTVDYLGPGLYGKTFILIRDLVPRRLGDLDRIHDDVARDNPRMAFGFDLNAVMTRSVPGGGQQRNRIAYSPSSGDPFYLSSRKYRFYILCYHSPIPRPVGCFPVFPFFWAEQVFCVWESWLPAPVD